MNNKTTSESQFDPDDESLDKLLQGWGDQRNASVEHLNQLQDRLMGTGRQSKTTSPPVENTPSKPWLMVVLATAAVLFAAVGVYWFSSGADGIPRVTDKGSSAIELARGGIDDQCELLDQFHQVYGNQMSWVSDVDGELNVQLNNQQSVGDGKFVAIRLALIARKNPDTNAGNDASWKLVRSIDLLAGDEELVDLSRVVPSLTRLSVWAFQVDRDLITIDVDCRLEAPVHLDVVSSRLQKVGETKQIFSVTEDGTEYRLYQTAIRCQTSQQGNVGLLPRQFKNRA